MSRKADEYSEQETQQRFLGSLKAALNTPPKPLKSMPKKGVPAQSKKGTIRKSKIRRPV